MNDCGTMCRACNRASNGEEYCRKCDDAIAAKERADDERGFALPVKAESGGFSSWIEDCNRASIVSISALVIRNHRELAEVIADSINAHYGECDGDGA